MENSAGSYVGTRLLARNTLLNLVGQGAPLVVAVVAIPILIPRIGTDRFGLLVIAWAVLGYFSLFDVGLGRSLTQLVAERLGSDRRDGIPALARTGLFMMAGVGLLGGAVLHILSPLLVFRILNLPSALEVETLIALRLLALAVPFVVVTAGLRGILEAVQWFGWVNAIRVPQGIFTYLGPLAVLPYSRSLPAMVAALVVIRFVVWLAYGLVSLRAFPELRIPIGFQWSEARSLLRLGGWITVSNVVGPLMVYLDRVLIGAVLTAAAVAYYATPFEVVSRLWIIPGAIVGVFFPAFATSFSLDRDRAARLFRDSARAVLLCVFPLAFVLMALAPDALGVWVGVEFAVPGAPVARWLLLGVVMNALAHIPFGLIQGIGRPDITAKLHMVEAPFYFALLWWLLSAYGITGAAMAWTFRATVDALLLFWLSSRLLPETRSESLRLMVWTAGALGVLGATLLPVDDPLMRTLFLGVLFIVSVGAAWHRLLPTAIRVRLKRS